MAKKKIDKSLDALKATVSSKDPHIIDLSNDIFTKDYGKLPTGIPELDELLGGGLAKGKLTEIFGWESSGKSAIVDSLITEIVRVGGYAHVIETERAHEKNRIRQKLLNLPCTTEKLPEGKPLTLEEWTFLKEEEQMSEVPVPEEDKLYDPVEEVIWSGADTIEEIIKEHITVLEAIDDLDGVDYPCAIIVDSIAACGSIKEEEAEVGDQQFSPHAMVISKNLRNKIITLAAKNKVAIIWLNQLRDTIKTGGRFAGLKGAKQTSDDYQTFGGKAIRFYASTRLSVADVGKYKLEIDKKNHKPVGQWCEVNIIKSKIWGVSPWRSTRYIIGYNGGTECAWGVLEHLKNFDLIVNAGSHGSRVEGIDDKYFTKNTFEEYYFDNKEALEKLIYENTEVEDVEKA